MGNSGKERYFQAFIGTLEEILGGQVRVGKFTGGWFLECNYHGRWLEISCTRNVQHGIGMFGQFKEGFKSKPFMISSFLESSYIELLVGPFSVETIDNPLFGKTCEEMVMLQGMKCRE